jgi:hypothetical protein
MLPPMDKLKPGNEVEPKLGFKKDESYRPAQSLVHRLSDGENWEKLAARYKREAKQIMRDNFGTTDPYEVNWYLGRYVKCDKATADRYNWRFSTSSRGGGGVRPGILYIIPNWFAIQDAARLLARRAIIQWLDNAFLGPTMVIGDSFRLRGRNISWRPTFLQDFTRMLRLQGATDDLSHAWAEAVHKALLNFSHSIESTIALPVPQIDGGGDRVPANCFLVWKAFEKATTSTTAFFDLMDVDGMSMNDAAARQAVGEFGRWWQERMNNVAESCLVEIGVHGNYVVSIRSWEAITLSGNLIKGASEAVWR